MNNMLSFTLIQPDMVWEDKAANLRHYEDLLAGETAKKEVVVLPEMFSTGFSMEPQRLAEGMDGATVKWMQELAAKHRVILTGSLIIEEGGNYYNRFIWMQPDGRSHHYDKRHLFGFAGEDAAYSRGERRVIVQVKGWKILLQVCYDLRFPVFARNRAGAPYDAILYTANWPQRRAAAWNTLLPARAIENQCYVVAVNRVGEDKSGNAHQGDSAVYGPMGETLWRAPESKEAVHTVVLDKSVLEETRAKLPFLKDGDGFVLG